jgi:hypothetical protein
MMSTDLESLARRLQRLEDIEAIKQLKHRYWRACDRQKPDDVQDCFLPEGAVVDYENVGRFEDRESFVDLYRRLGCQPAVIDIHHGQNPEIEITGPDSARGTWDVYYYGINTEARTATQLAGYYHDDYVRRDGRWWIAETRFFRSSFQVTEISAEGGTKVMALSR